MKTTAQHFKLFQSEVERWYTQLGCVGWRIEFLHEKMPDSRAEIRYNHIDHVALFVLAVNWDGPVTDEAVRRAALHEVVHLLIAPVTGCAILRFVTEQELREAQERVVRHLAHIIGGVDG